MNEDLRLKAEIEVLNADDLDIEELEHRLEMAYTWADLAKWCIIDICWINICFGNCGENCVANCGENCAANCGTLYACGANCPGLCNTNCDPEIQVCGET